jgi:hypothetical protein
LSVSRQYRAIGKLRATHFGGDDLHAGARIGGGFLFLARRPRSGLHFSCCWVAIMNVLKPF